MNMFNISLTKATAILFAFMLTIVMADLFAQNQTNQIKKKVEAVKPSGTPIKTLELKSMDSDSFSEGTFSLPVDAPDEWDIQFYELQSQDALVNPKKRPTANDLARLAAKLNYRNQQLNSVGVGEESNIEPEGVVYDDDGNPMPEYAVPNSILYNGDGPINSTEAADQGSNQEADQPLIDVEGSSNYAASTSSVPDGCGAVSGNGYIVVSNNTDVEFFDDDGNQLYSENENTFWSPLNPTANIYDPRVFYDTYNNRFVLLALHGSSSDLTELYIAFSVSSNPTSGWWFYDVDANPGSAGKWFDYPSIAYNELDLIVSGNMSPDGSGIVDESKVFLLSLLDGYAGSSLGGGYFDDVEYDSGSNAITIKPVSYPFGTYFGGSYLVNKLNDDWLGLWFVDGDHTSATIDAYYVPMEGSRPSPQNASQSGTTATLQIGGRMQHAYYDGNGNIHYTFAYDDGNGNSRILIGEMDVSELSSIDYTFGQEGRDYAYPWIMPWATSSGSWDGGSLVAFLRSGSDIFPQFRVVHGYSDQSWGNSVLVKGGESAITTTTRWGDYIGGGRRENTGQKECWVYGQYGKNSDHALWVAEVVLDIGGCTDPSACNYDSTATADDGSCEYDSCSGCTDAEACNYNSNAEIDDDSCTYPGCTDWYACNYQFGAGCSDGSCCYDSCLELEMPIGIYIPLLGINTMLYYTLSDNNSGADIESGNNSSGPANFCLEPGCYHMNITGATVSWTLALDPLWIIMGADYTIETGTGPASFDFIVGDGGEAAGCMDDNACNYDDAALCDNNTCCYSSCVEIQMTDSYGDGWNDNEWEIREMGTDEIVIDHGTLAAGFEGAATSCLEPKCYHFKIDNSQGMYPLEIGWTILDTDDGNLSGGFEDEVVFTIDGGGTDSGCTDSFACNFSLLAICDDGSCCYDNCCTLTMNDSYGDGWQGAQLSITGNGDSSAYSMSAGFTESVLLCLPDGCFDIEVSDDQYDYEVSWELMCPNVLLGGGSNFDHILTLNEVNGCTDSLACNYDVLANCDDGCCEYPGCMDPQACDYNECANCPGNIICDFSCQGCTYEVASNYNPESTMDDGSCEFIIAPPESTCAADINGDGFVSVMDLLLVLEEFGNDCGLVDE